MSDDYRKLIERGHEYAVQLADSTHIQHGGAALVVHLADAVEALVADNEKLRVSRRLWRRALVDRINEYRAERDALQAQLNEMTTEWGVRLPDGRVTGFRARDYAEEHIEYLRKTKRYAALVSRGVHYGHWVEVADDAPWRCPNDPEGEQ